MADTKKRVFDSDELQTCKKSRIEGQGDGLKSFQGFEVTRTLSENASSKSIFVHGKFEGSSDDAVVLLEKTPFTQVILPNVLSSDTKLSVDMRNDIYGQYICYPPQDINTVKCTVIYPATSKHINKYTSQQPYMVYETAEDYGKITLPYLEAQQLSIQWVYNILDKKAEVERILFEDPNKDNGFILLPDMKWDQRQLDNLYCVAICHKRGIKSLRDLDGSSLPMLRNILSKGKEIIQAKYNIPSSQLRVYVHYQPSYYHFHVHFTHLKFDAPGSSAGKAHLLQDVIDNIENIDKDFYKKKTLPFIARENDKLFLEFQKEGKT